LRVPTSLGFALAGLGWGPDFEEALRPFASEGLAPGRIAVQHRGSYGVYTNDAAAEPLSAEISGRLRHEAASSIDLPAVGDWVALRRPANAGRAVIEAVLPRRTMFVRRAPADRQRGLEEQVVGANIDVALLVYGLDRGANPRRLERYLVLAWESGAQPAIVLTKADLCDSVAEEVAEAERVAIGVPVHAVSSVSGLGLDELRPYLAGNRTVAALGPSGVGKSTLINRLSGLDLQEVAEVRADGRGRHTTTRRELIVAPGGGLFLDTPGMRALQLGEADLDETFQEVADLASRCRFSDCAHEREPGCAVLAAIQDGTLDPARLAGYRKLLREIEHLEQRGDPRAASERRKRYRRMARARRRVSW
jgi:ribosome biogenesis GTPase